MEEEKLLNYIKRVLENSPQDWLELTTHRLDLYDEKQAKTKFINQFEDLFKTKSFEASALQQLPSAYDYIRLGHPLSCILEWSVAKLNNIQAINVISFSSKTAPVLAILRKNLLNNISTRIVHSGELPDFFDTEIIQTIYAYPFEVQQTENLQTLSPYKGSTIFISNKDEIGENNLSPSVDFYVSMHAKLGSIVLVNGAKNESYVSEIQHVRRRETIAMTPANCLIALNRLVGNHASDQSTGNYKENKKSVISSIKEITGSNIEALLASSGLSMQYAITMGLIHHAMETHPDKAIKLVVPPNCYGGTNDQARRVAACLNNVEVRDLPVDREHEMVDSLEVVLSEIAKENAIPFIIVEIPTNPRVEVPNLINLEEVLRKSRHTANGEKALKPVFILDQTFCPNFHFLGEEDILSNIQTIAYVSGSKFPSGGKCTAGYAVANRKAEALMEKIELHLNLCDNQATELQIEILAKQMPSMNQRIHDAYMNTRDFVDFIQKSLPEAKINFVSQELADQGFTPSVFSLDLPSKGDTHEEREAYKRDLNHQLINLMITNIPNASKHCVSYGQLRGCYWTIPATSTQGTTKEGDKDYIARVALSPDMDLDLHKKVFSNFVREKINPPKKIT